MHASHLFIVTLLFMNLISACKKSSKNNPGIQTVKPLIEIPSGGSSAPVLAAEGGSVTASIDPNATATQLIQADPDSNIADVFVAFPPGSLTTAADITMREGSAIEHDLLVGELSLEGSASITESGLPVQIGASAPVDLEEPMILSLPIPSSLALTASSMNFGIFYRIQVQATGERLAGFVPASELTIDADNKLLYATKYFGWFQIVAFASPVAAIQKIATLPTFLGIDVVSLIAKPSCGKADLGRTIYLEEDSVFQYCGLEGWDDIDLQGPKGDTGATGPQGPTGATGTSGSALQVYDSSDNAVGTFVSFGNSGISVGEIAFMKISSGSSTGFVSVNLGSGYIMPVCISGNCDVYYEANDCSGTPHLEGIPLRNSLLTSYSSASMGYLRALGSESVTTMNTFMSRRTMDTPTCFATSVGGFGPKQVRPVTSSFTYPSGIQQAPYGAPMRLND